MARKTNTDRCGVCKNGRCERHEADLAEPPTPTPAAEVGWAVRLTLYGGFTRWRSTAGRVADWRGRHLFTTREEAAVDAHISRREAVVLHATLVRVTRRVAT